MSVALLVFFAPLLLVLLAIVALTSSGPALYRQSRVGLRGRRFTMFKLRTMRKDAEAGTGAVWSRPGDPRVTPVGRLLRRSHLDELPQLLNVARGEMAMIGPRPERPEIVERLSEQIPGYADRLQVLPGITGLAQVAQAPDRDLDDVRRKVMLDRDYIRSADPAVDLRILWHTLATVVPRGEREKLPRDATCDGTPGAIASAIVVGR